MAELLLGTPLFPGDSGVDQLIEIIKVPSNFASIKHVLRVVDFGHTKQGGDYGNESKPHIIQVPADQASSMEQGVPQQGPGHRC